MGTQLRAAVCHAAPVFLSAGQTAQKCISLIQKASRHSADLVVFPESYIPGFPVWSSFLPPTQTHDFFQRMSHESVYVDGEEIRAVRHAAKQAGTIVSLGISEKVAYSSATLFNSNLLIGPEGDILIHHRKLMPTFFEKLTWSPGDGYGLRVAQTRAGKIGALICGENTNPLARYALMAQGEQVHISTWPAIWPTRAPSSPSSGTPSSAPTTPPESRKDSGTTPGSTRGANYDNVAANRTRAAAHCFEAKCFGILSSAYLDQATIETLSAATPDPAGATDILTRSPRAASMFLDPTGALLPGFTVDATGSKHREDLLQNQEDILYADMDLDDCIEGKQYHDVVGGYQRLDVFQVKIDRTRREPVTFTTANSDTNVV